MSSSQRAVHREAVAASLFALTAVVLAGVDVGVHALMAAGLTENAAGTGITLVATVAGLTALLRIHRVLTA
ncbi:hypothetical protein SAMN06269185_2118 [Natronoarchaeum philippinense]|uniref:Uncharacterized protein n=1 Tax=Natronoarchaeum philippinense TaxID=558529 RepID=A0A285NWM0_NATPI|nr:hypothetical protein [Natronoarchaeum philippinense]SNZ13323.1 hypothetical protein SAMN06269185_2118 [Natronoarchaeum philippinense]